MSTSWRNTVRVSILAGLVMVLPLQTWAQDISRPVATMQGLGNGFPSPRTPDNSRFQNSGRARVMATFGWLALHVQPLEAEVYVDGFRAGTVAEYSLGNEKLKLRSGTHVIVIHHPEFRTIRVQVSVNGGRSYKLDQRMEPLFEAEIAMETLVATFFLPVHDEEFQLKEPLNKQNM